MKLEDLQLFPHPAGFQHKELFDNGLGISVIPESDGVHYEAAIFVHEDKRNARILTDWDRDFDGVFRYLTVDQVEELIDRVKGYTGSPKQFGAPTRQLTEG